MAFAKLLRNLLRDEGIGERVVPIIPDEARTFGMDPLFKEVGIYSALGQRYDPVDSNLVLSYREANDGQVLEEGITEAGSTASLQAAGTSYATHAEPMIPFYIFYSMFGFQRTGDELWAFGRRPRPRLHAGRHRRAHDAQRRGPPARGRAQPRAGLALPVLPRLRPGLRLRDRGHHPRRPGAHARRRSREDVFYYLALYNENHVMPARPEWVTDEDIVRGPVPLPAGAEVGCEGAPGDHPRLRGDHAAGPGGPGAAGRNGTASRADVYSAPSFQLLRNEALEVEHWNLRNPGEERACPSSPSCSPSLPRPVPSSPCPTGSPPGRT